MAVTVTEGKTTAMWCRMLVDGNNLSGDSRTLAGAGIAWNNANVTGWGQYVENVKGAGVVNFGDYAAFFNNNISAPSIDVGAHTVLKNGVDDIYATVAIGTNDVPAIGDVSFSASLTQFTYLLSATTGEAVTLAANFQSGQNAVAGWGRVLSAGISQSATITLDSYDNGAAMPNGAMWIYHIAQSDGDMTANDWDVVVEHAPDDATWATVTTVNGVGGSVTSGILTTSSPVDQYTRINLTKNAGTDIKVWMVQIPL